VGERALFSAGRPISLLSRPSGEDSSCTAIHTFWVFCQLHGRTIPEVAGGRVRFLKLPGPGKKVSLLPLHIPSRVTHQRGRTFAVPLIPLFPCPLPAYFSPLFPQSAEFVFNAFYNLYPTLRVAVFCFSLRGRAFFMLSLFFQGHGWPPVALTFSSRKNKVPWPTSFCSGDLV